MGPAQVAGARRALQGAVVAALATFGVEAMWRVGIFSWADAAVSDWWHITRGARVDPDTLPVVLVAIDRESLERVDDPLVFWGPHLATAIRAITASGASGIALDLVFHVSGESWLLDHGFDDSPIARSWDAGFREQLAAGNTSLATMYKDPEERLVRPQNVADLAADEARSRTCFDTLDELVLMLPSVDTHMGFASMAVDADGVLRSFTPTPGLFARTRVCPRLHIATVMALTHLGLDRSAEAWEIAGRTLRREDAEMRIAFAGPPGTFPRIPFWRFVVDGGLRPEDRSRLAGKVAIIGTDRTFHHDVWWTPYNRFAAQESAGMPGYEAQANAITTLVEGWRILSLSDAARGALFLGFALAVAEIFSFATLRTSVAVMLLGATCWPFGGYLAFTRFDLLLPSASLATLGVVVFAGVYTVRFAGEVRERRHLREVFSRYVSDDVVREILSSPTGLGLGGATREITILFADIRNFTTISEHLRAEEVVEMLNTYFALACPPILEHRGRIDKFIGDAVMAVFGAPIAHPDHARDAIHAALAMAAATSSFAVWCEERFHFSELGLPPFDVGIGVHTGLAVAGNVGFDKAVEYGVIGDAVNVASRIEGQTKQLGVRVLVSRATLDRAGGGFEVGLTVKLSVKGKAEPVEVAQILGVVRPSATGPRPGAPFAAPGGGHDRSGG